MFKKLIAFVLFFLITTISINTSEVFAVTYNLTYDANGNLVQGKDKYYEYDSFNNLIRVRNDGPAGTILEEYTYDHNGNRVKKVEYLLGGGNNTYYYIGNDFVRKVNSSGTYDDVYYYDGNNLVGKNESGTMYFFHPDHLGSTNLVTDLAGNNVEETTYYPYGLILSGGTTENRLYTGKEKDSTDIHYFGARYYDPYMRRFIQPDPVIQNVYNPQGLNRYSYVLNNPYKYVDPDGRFVAEATLIVGALATLASTAITHIEYVEEEISFEQAILRHSYNILTTGYSIIGEATNTVSLEKLGSYGSKVGLGVDFLEVSSIDETSTPSTPTTPSEFIPTYIPTPTLSPTPTYTPTPTKDKPSVPNTQPVYTYNPSPKPGDYEYRSDPKTEKLIEEKVKSRERTKSRAAKEEWKRRYREVYG